MYLSVLLRVPTSDSEIVPVWGQFAVWDDRDFPPSGLYYLLLNYFYC